MLTRHASSGRVWVFSTGDALGPPRAPTDSHPGRRRRQTPACDFIQHGQLTHR